MAARSGGKVSERVRQAHENLAGVAPRLCLAREFIQRTDLGWKGGLTLPEGMDPNEVRSHPALMAAMLNIGFATWAAPHGDAAQEEHRKGWHAHIYPDIWPELERFRVVRGFARELVWFDSATAVGIAVGGLDMGGEGGTFAERIEAAKMVAYGIQAGTIDAVTDLPAVAYFTSTDREGVCIAVAYLDLNKNDKLIVSRWGGEDFGGNLDTPLKLDVWASAKALEASDEE